MTRYVSSCERCGGIAVPALEEIAVKQRVRAEKAEAEVERLRKLVPAPVREPARPRPCGIDWCEECREPLRHEMQVAVECAGHEQEAREEIARLRDALVTIERIGADGGLILATRGDGHSCVWCRGMLTPCPAVLASDALQPASAPARSPLAGDSCYRCAHHVYASGLCRLADADACQVATCMHFEAAPERKP